ncbi:MAG: aconitase family protein [Myxococcota bacterium]|nr:aconitase family protein [Myxococcota bacterium]
MTELEFGRALYLTRDPDALRSQLTGEPCATDVELADDVSTDEMCPAWACYFYDERLGQYCLVGFRGLVVETGAVARGRFSVLVGGERLGSGSSRETAPFAQRAAGIRLVVARSFAKIYRQNCHNLGLYTSTDFGLLERIARGERIARDELTRELDPLSREVLFAGGLGAYARARRSGHAAYLRPRREARPLNLVEKILVAHSDADNPGIAPGDALFVRADLRFSHDYTTAMVDAELRTAFGDEQPLFEPESILVFRDHLALLDRVMPEGQRRLGLLDQANELAAVQAAFAARHGLRSFGHERRSDTGICHNLVLERFARPGEVIVGTDSHTCMAGAVGCLAFGVGSTDMAAGLVSGDFRISAPESVRLELSGALAPGVFAKDVWLTLLAQDDVKRGVFAGRVLEIGGAGLSALTLDERATLANMAVEGGAVTAIVELDERACRELSESRGVDARELWARRVTADAGARYAAELSLALDHVEPMIALPSDPKNSVPLRELERAHGGPVAIDIAYGGSCTGSKPSDLDAYARVLGQALERGLSVAPGVSLYIQFGSSAVRRYAESRGYVDILTRAGAELLDPGCGACIGAGPGASSRAETVTVSAANRNYPGRSGPGRVYLASPAVVAASAVLGRIAGPDAFTA